MTLYHRLFNSVLARTDPESIHRTAFGAIQTASPVLGRRHHVPGLKRRMDVTDPAEVMGISFPNRLGMAAGFDKNAEGIDSLGALGFGHVEIGTVTGEPQPGNPRPRLFRLVEDRAIVNRMGFNNDGATEVAWRLADRIRTLAESGEDHRKVGPILGINIGKTKAVPDQDAVLDYEKSTRLLAPYADYLVVNVSSPNTPGLRDLQAVDKLEPLLRAVRAQADRVTASRVPLLVKIAPDLADDDVLAVADLANAIGLDGMIATNTTISRDGLRTDAAQVEAAGAGGLSGPPLAARSLQVLQLLRPRLDAGRALISVGGITTPADAIERVQAGADLVQGYTAFIYEGPMWPTRIVRGLRTADPSRGTAPAGA